MAKKIILIVIIIVLAAVLAFLLWNYRKEEQETAEISAKIEEEIRPLNVEINELTNELSDLEDAYKEQMNGIGTIVMLYTDAGEQVYENAYPQMKDYGYVGVIALSDESFPGEEGCMSMDQFTELLDAGWEWCALYSEESDSPKSDILSVIRRAEDAGIERTDSVYFSGETYSEEYDEWLSEHDFTAAVHHGETGKDLIISESGEDIWYPGAVGWRSSDRRSWYSEAITARGNIVFAIEMGAKGEEADRDYLESMLESVHDSCENNELLVMTLTGARAYRRDLENGAADVQAAWTKEKEEIEARIQDLKNEISDIHRAYEDK